MTRIRRIGTWGIVPAIFALVSVVPVRAHTLYVANNGNDDLIPPCGGNKVLACRSISKAIAVAVPGDSIVVGPGIYGDLDGSGTIGDSSGEEAAEVGSGCECMIKVDKSLVRIFGRDGALPTTLDGRGLVQSVVHIQADGVQLRGFTIRNGAANGVLTDASVGNVRILGNIASSNPVGFNVAGNDLTTRVQDNIATENTDGFSVRGGLNRLYGNRAVRNSGNGFVLSGFNFYTRHNIGDQNNVGFRVNVDAANLYQFDHASAVANVTAGVLVEATVAGGSVVLNESNLYGNGAAANNCGLMVDNQDADMMHVLNVDATDNFWGTTTGGPGPGPDPADSAGGSCNVGPGSTNLSVSGASPKEIFIIQHSFK